MKHPTIILRAGRGGRASVVHSAEWSAEPLSASTPAAETEEAGTSTARAPSWGPSLRRQVQREFRSANYLKDVGR
jgi:hypothetical protein